MHTSRRSWIWVILVALAGASHALLACGGGGGAPPAGRRADMAVLLDQLRNPHPQHRRQAAYRLGELRDPAAVPFLIEALRAEDKLPVVRAQLKALGTIASPEAYQVIMEYTKHQDPKIAKAAMNAYKTWQRYRGRPVGGPGAAPPAAVAPPPGEAPSPGEAPAPGAPPAPGGDDEE